MKKKYVVIVMSLLMFFVLSIYKITLLEVYVFDKGPDFNKVILSIPTKVNDKFSVKWIHSVSKRPIVETYKIEDNLKIAIDEMRFDTYSANLPGSPEYNTKWEYHDDYIRVYNYDVQFDAVPVVIGKVIADHALYYKGKTIHLKDIYKPGGYVKIRAVHKSVIKYIVEGAFN